MSAQFRITSIAFDDNEEVASVTAVGIPACLDFVRAHAPSACAEEARPGELAAVILSRNDVFSVHAAAGKVRGTSSEYEGSHPVYDSLCMIIYGLIETE